MIHDAWLASADAPVGYPIVNVRAIENGKVRATGTEGSALKRSKHRRFPKA
jgi:hypothetical protein